MPVDGSDEELLDVKEDGSLSRSPHNRAEASETNGITRVTDNGSSQSAISIESQGRHRRPRLSSRDYDVYKARKRSKRWEEMGRDSPNNVLLCVELPLQGWAKKCLCLCLKETFEDWLAADKLWLCIWAMRTIFTDFLCLRCTHWRLCCLRIGFYYLHILIQLLYLRTVAQRFP